MKRVILLTGHYYQSRRRAGFHWLADAYWRAGWEVIFLTVGISWLSWLRRDHRLKYPVHKEAGHLKWINDRLASFVWFTPVHPVDLKLNLLNAMTRKLFSGYGEWPLGEMEELVGGADTVIFESSYGLALFERFKRLNPEARYIYRVSDDLRMIRVHPMIREAEMRYAPSFHLISVPSESLYRRFADLPNASLHHHGIRKDLFDAARESPYKPGTINVVFVGNAYLDYDFLEQASRYYPSWNFQIIGPLNGLPVAPNIFAYGEMPFAETVPYIKYADIGLHTLEYKPGAEAFTDSLKIIQYQYCELPVVAPKFLRSGRKSVYYYRPGDGDTIRTALKAAQECGRIQAASEGIYSWDDFVRLFSG